MMIKMIVGEVECSFSHRKSFWLVKEGQMETTDMVGDNSINEVITEKRRLWKVWKNGGSKEDYAKAKKIAKRAVFTAKKRPWMTNSVIKMMLPCFV